VTQVVECLPSKFKALSSNTNIAKRSFFFFKKIRFCALFLKQNKTKNLREMVCHVILSVILPGYPDLLHLS
jgi:hypothetical protein